ncbi:MAG: hypothetical protein JWP63_1547, partial [Candidatus Solibacter sp.]|nr:hypothetical protein [Candidatus Solibacter sp.]
IEEAFSIKPWQVSGPNWLETEKFELAAVTPPGTDTATARLMLQRMLAGRFGLKVHRESKQSPVYALVVAKNGPKLKEVVNAESSLSESTAGRYSGTAISIARLVDRLSAISDHPVIDATGLPGRYKVDLAWTPDYEDLGDGRGKRDRGMLSVLQQEFGLKLERRSMAFEFLVIDHIEKTPTPN